MRTLMRRVRGWLAAKREAGRRWAIRKLGGYVSQIGPAQEPTVLIRSAPKNVQLFWSERHTRPIVDAIDENRRNWVENMIKVDAATDVMKALLENDAFEIYKTIDEKANTITIRATLQVVMPEGAGQ